MSSTIRSHHCAELNLSHIGQQVTLSGWVNRRRDHGGLIFIDLRDRYGITQLLLDPQSLGEKIFAVAESLRSEWVINITGTVIFRGEEKTNPALATGEIEVRVDQLIVFSQAKTPPFPIAEEGTLPVHEELLLKYRYLDIRRTKISQALSLRHKVALLIRNHLSANHFLEISTPILGKRTPEGARDYLVPSRKFPGSFYALPQSPQLFKQLLMIGGSDRYFQLCTCFRDEDLRADRQPEFTQLDIELSFASPAFLMDLIENLLVEIWKETQSREIKTPFIRMSYHDCMELYGCDKPDLRFDLSFKEVSSYVARSSFSILQAQIERGNPVKAFVVPKGAEISRKEIDGYTEFVQTFGLQGLVWIKKTEGSFSSNVLKFFTPELLEELSTFVGAHEGDLILIAAQKKEVLHQSLDHLRRKIAADRGLIDPTALAFLWVVDFPLFLWNEEEGRIESAHHPFTAAVPQDLELLGHDPLAVKAQAYDLVLNGYEIGGGSQRIHDAQLQKAIFTLLGLSEEQIEEKFGFFLEALQFGTPPHLGIALGFDRLMMILLGTNNIRDVIAFPKTQKASDIMLKSPAPVTSGELKELHIKL